MFSHVCMSIWQVHIHNIIIWSCSSRWYVPAKVAKLFKNLENVVGIADYISIVGYGEDSGDYNRTLKQVMQISHHENLKHNENKCHLHNSLGQLHPERNATRPKEAVHYMENASLIIKKEFLSF